MVDCPLPTVHCDFWLLEGNACPQQKQLIAGVGLVKKKRHVLLRWGNYLLDDGEASHNEAVLQHVSDGSNSMDKNGNPEIGMKLGWNWINWLNSMIISILNTSAKGDSTMREVDYNRYSMFMHTWRRFVRNGVWAASRPVKHNFPYLSSLKWIHFRGTPHVQTLNPSSRW